MDADDQTYDMLDILAYNCNNLTEKLLNNKPEDSENILLDYLKKTDVEHKSIHDFTEDLDWFNVTEPLSTNGILQGKIVILDFFTYCCINCMHILPDLKRIEDKHSVEDGLVVVGVHSAKFDNEKDSANILSAVQRYNITHPVVNDGSSSMWIDLKIKCWPTLLILGPRANPIFILMGEGHADTLQKYISAAMKFYKTTNSIKAHSLPLNPATELIMSSNLKFPGKICCSKSPNNSTNASDTTELFAISDSGNHRIIVTTANGNVLHKIGGKNEGFIDGDFNVAQFNSPQGLVFLNNDILYVADTENHAIRRIDLKQKKVETVAGTGHQGIDNLGGKIGREQELSSPWDLAIYRTRDMDMSFHIDEQSIPEKDILLIAAAGTHQIWALFIEDVIWWKFKKFPAGTLAAIAGNGKEENRNNSYPYNAAFAQPSGLAISKDNKELYIADSESSCIRKLSLADGKVLPVVGGDRNPLNLFAFGDVDGAQLVAKLQHPLGVAFNQKENSLYVADTYNHKIKKIDLTSNACSTYKITDQSKSVQQFNEPGGLCLNEACDKLYVADTNNHTIEIVDLKSMSSIPLKLSFNDAQTSFDLGQQLHAKRLNIRPEGGKIKLKILLEPDNSVKLTENAPQKWTVTLSNDKWKLTEESNNLMTGQKNVSVLILVPGIDSSQVEEFITCTFKLSLCSGDLCFPRILSIIFPITYCNNDGLSCCDDIVTIQLNKVNCSIVQ